MGSHASGRDLAVSGFMDMLRDLTGRYPITDADIEDLRKFVSQQCQKAPVHVHKAQQAERRLELAACEAIALWYQGKFPDAWLPVTVRPGWPKATCVIARNPTTKAYEATLRFSFGPETESDTGGIDIDAVRFNVQMAPPNLLTRAMQAFEKRDLKAEREADLAPIGLPSGKPELPLTQPVKAKPTPKTDSNSTAKKRMLAKGKQQ